MSEHKYMPTPEQYLSTLDDKGLGGPQRPHRSKFLRYFVVFILAVLAAVMAYGVFIAVNVAKISTNPWQLGQLASDEDGRTNILVLGVGDPGHAGAQLTDTMMILSLDRVHNRVAQISIPRDLRVSIPGYGTAKINAVHAIGGVPLARQVVSQTFGIPIHYYVKTNFTGLKELVDAVGGVEVDVKSRLYDSQYPCDDNQYKVCGLDIPAGKQVMDGTQALKYARCRKGTCGNDYGRAARQQEIIDLVQEKAAQWQVLINPARLVPIVTAVRSGIETDMSAPAMLETAYRWREARPAGVVGLVLSTSPDGYLRGDPLGSSDLLPVGGNFTAIADRIKRIFD